jgi:hypothetical protein
MARGARFGPAGWLAESLKKVHGPVEKDKTRKRRNRLVEPGEIDKTGEGDG